MNTIDNETHATIEAALNTIMTDMLDDLVDGGKVLAQDIRDHLQVATAPTPNLERIAALDAAASR